MKRVGDETLALKRPHRHHFQRAVVDLVRVCAHVTKFARTTGNVISHSCPWTDPLLMVSGSLDGAHTYIGNRQHTNNIHEPQNPCAPAASISHNRSLAVRCCRAFMHFFRCINTQYPDALIDIISQRHGDVTCHPSLVIPPQ